MTDEELELRAIQSELDAETDRGMAILLWKFGEDIDDGLSPAFALIVRDAARRLQRSARGRMTPDESARATEQLSKLCCGGESKR